MKISVVGVGYVGLVTAVGLASGGHQVCCIDKDPAKIQKLKKGEVPIYEPGLEKIFKQVLKKKLLNFSSDLAAGIKQSRIIFVAVGTPQLRSGAADLRSVKAVIKQIGELSNTEKIIVIKSTVPVGTAENSTKLLEKILPLRQKKFPIFVVSNPEFLRQGKALEDFLHPDRIVIGSPDLKIRQEIKNLYSFIQTKFVLTDWASAELIKYASNAFLATKISFINEISDLCEKTGADVLEVALGMGLDPRITPQFLNAGIGYGGSCFPKDTRALHFIARGIGNRFKLLSAVIEVNRLQKFRFLEKVKTILGSFNNKKIAILGLAFKGGTDDIRESIAIEICKYLIEEKAHLSVFDPEAMKNAQDVLGNKVVYTQDAYRAAKSTEAILILAEWQDFKNLDFVKLKRVVKKANLFDGKNFLDSKKVRQAGFKYFGVGIKDDFKLRKI